MVDENVEERVRSIRKRLSKSNPFSQDRADLEWALSLLEAFDEDTVAIAVDAIECEITECDRLHKLLGAPVQQVRRESLEAASAALRALNDRA